MLRATVKSAMATPPPAPARLRGGEDLLRERSTHCAESPREKIPAAAAAAAATYTAVSEYDGARRDSSRMSSAPVPFPAQSKATSMSDLTERFDLPTGCKAARSRRGRSNCARRRHTHAGECRARERARRIRAGRSVPPRPGGSRRNPDPGARARIGRARPGAAPQRDRCPSRTIRRTDQMMSPPEIGHCFGLQKIVGKRTEHRGQRDDNREISQSGAAEVGPMLQRGPACPRGRSARGRSPFQRHAAGDTGSGDHSEQWKKSASGSRAATRSALTPPIKPPNVAAAATRAINGFASAGRTAR